ncbi:MAG TPA: rhomboid family intramembrane serine protease [Bacteroidia bacterium]|jgi:rhomboid protease GluP|nr:rhomboid family intramembrane serine protease [Bacteroidia bacterium]
MSEEQENTSNTSEQKPPLPVRRPPLFWLTPRKGYFITPILIDINILVLLVMIATGVHPVTPDPNVLVAWGANVRSLTMNGQPWRIFTCMFLHYGIIHLAANMWALFQLGRMLEPFIGRWRFLILYILSGLAASCVSMWYHSDSAAVGASGAIFGIFGIFAALLTTDLIRKDIRGKMLRSILIAIGINLLIGLSWQIDNSAHIGGLIAGTIGGYLIYFDLKKFYVQQIKQNTFLIIASLVIAAGISVFWIITPKTSEIDDLMKRFAYFDDAAQQYYSRMDSMPSADSVRIKFVEPYRHCGAISDTLTSEENLTDDGKKIVQLYQQYSEARLNQADYLYRLAYDRKNVLTDSTQILSKKGDDILVNLDEMLKKVSK